MKIKKLGIFAAGIFALTFALCSCFDATETENRKYVVLMGMDSDGDGEAEAIGEGGKYIMSAGEAGLASDIGQSSEKQETILVGGDSLPEIRRLADMYSSKKMYFGQLKTVIFGSGVYSDGETLAETVYTMERMDDINTKIVVFASDNAAQTVRAVMDKGSKGGLYLWDYYKNNGGDAELSEYMNFERLIKCLRQGGTFVIPKISAENGEVFLDGGEVIKDGEYMGSVTAEDIRNVKWIKGRAKGELITAEGVSAGVKSQKTDILRDEGNVKIYISAEVSAESAADRINGAAFEEEIVNSLTASVNKAEEMDADFLGIGEYDGLEIYADVEIISSGVIK